MQRFSLFVAPSRQRILPFGAAFARPPPVPLPYEKPGGTAYTVTKTHIPENSVSTR